MSQPYDKFKVPTSESSPLDVLIKMENGGITLRAVDNFMLTLGFDWINVCWKDPRVTLESPDTSTGTFVVLGDDFVWEMWKPYLYLDSTKKPFMEYMKESGKHRFSGQDRSGFILKKCCLDILQLLFQFQYFGKQMAEFAVTYQWFWNYGVAWI